MRIDHRCAHILMPQQLLDRSNIITILEQMSREAVPKRMARDVFDKAGLRHGLLYSLLKTTRGRCVRGCLIIPVTLGLSIVLQPGTQRPPGFSVGYRLGKGNLSFRVYLGTRSEWLGYTSFPISRFSSAVGYSYNLDSIRDQAIYDTEWKSLQEEMSRTRNIWRPNLWVFTNSFNRTIKLSEESLRCLATSFSIPLGCCMRFSNRLGMDVYCREDIIALRFWFWLLARASA